jgi:hypothetical protein
MPKGDPMLTLERLVWLYRNWQEALSSSWQLQVKVFGYMLIITALAILCTSYLTHSWPFGSPGARLPQEKAVKAALDSTSSQNSNAIPSTSAEPHIHIAPNTPSAPKTLDGMQLCPDPDGDGYLVLCRLTIPIDKFEFPSEPPMNR